MNNPVNLEGVCRAKPGIGVPDCRLDVALPGRIAEFAETWRASHYNLSMAVFRDKQEELAHYETMMGVSRGRLAVTMDSITDAMALIGQHGVYCQSQRWAGKPAMDIQIIMRHLADAKELIQSVMEELKKHREPLANP